MDELSKSSEEPTPKPEEVEPVGESAPKPEEGSAAQPEVSGEPEVKPVLKLAEPSKELATRLLGKVSFEERVTGVEMNPLAGEMLESIYSFKRASGFLKGDRESLLDRDGWISYINLNDLKKWVGETLGDKELAQAIGETTKEYDSCTGSIERFWKNIELIRPVKELMEQRLKQCKEVIREET